MTTLQTLAALAWPAFLLICAVAAAFLMVLAVRNRSKWMPPLEDLVTLDSRGWTLIAIITSAGAFVMIGTSQLFSSSYWLALAIDSDGRTIPEDAGPFGWVRLISVTTIAALALSIVFELVSDIGAPTASGLKKENKKGTPEFLLVCTALAIVMSLASKWGFYEDKRNARSIEAAQIAAADTAAEKALQDAEAIIARLQDTPSAEIAQTTEESIGAQIADARTQRDNAILARDALPENQGGNKAKFQATIDALTASIAALEKEKIAAQKIREDAATLAGAKAQQKEALETIERDAGKLTGDKKEVVRIGDTIIIRLIRSGLHQALCFVFPIIALDAWAMSRKVRKRELASEKGAETRRNKNPAAVRDAVFEPAADEPGVPRFGGYLPAEPPAEGEAPGDPGEDADFEDLSGEDAGDNRDDAEGRPDDKN